MIATICTHLNTSADNAWALLKKRDTFLYITRGFLGFKGSKRWPETFYKGLIIETRLIFFHLFPSWKHSLHIIRLDDRLCELYSHESGGPIKVWNHLIKIKSENGNRCKYKDQVEIKAGILTPFIWGYAHIFYRYRQYRWKKLLIQKIK